MSRFTVSNAQQGGQAPAVEPQAWTPEQITRWHQQQAQLQAQQQSQQQLADPHAQQAAYAQQGSAPAHAWRQPQADGQAYAPPYAVPPSPHGAQAAPAYAAPDAWPQHPQHQQAHQPPQAQWPGQPQHQQHHQQQHTGGYADPTGQQPGWGAAPSPHAAAYGQPQDAYADPSGGQPQAGAFSPEPQTLAQIIEATRRSVAASAAQPQGYAADPRTGWPDQRGGDPFAAAEQPQAQPGHHDAHHTWDLANYPPVSDPRQAQFSNLQAGAAGWPDGAAAAPQAYGHGAYDAAADPHWANVGAGGQVQSGLDAAYDPSRAYPGNADPAASPTADGQFQYGVPPEGEAPIDRRGPSALIVGSALVGAIVLGGGLAWSYKRFTGGGSTAPAVVKADKTPAKAKPDQPGGKEVPHTDKKIFKQLGESGASPQPPAKSQGAPAQAEPQSPDGAPRRVTTLVVRPDGTLAPQSVQPAAPPAASTGVPGMVIDGGPRPAPRPPAEAAPPQAPLATATVPRPAEPPLQPQRLNEPARTVEPPRTRAPEAPARSERAEAAAKAEPAVKTPAVKKKAPSRDDAPPSASTAGTAASAAAAGATTTARVTTSSGGGFVTVLASRKTQDEAFRMFPDLQTKYADILSGKVPDVRETDLTKQGKGVVYRLVIGPPGSKESAIETCSKLKAQGFTGCWATPF